MSTIPRAFTTDDGYDRENAGDRRSRYGAYLAQHRHLFLDEGVPTAQVDWFAFSAWDIATSPIMSPGYVRTHARVLGTDPHWDDDGRPAIAVRLVAPAPPRVRDVLGSDFQTWRPQWDLDGEVYAWTEPWDNATASAFATLTLRVPIPADVLPTPRYRSGIPDLATAKHAVTTLCTVANTVTNYLLAVLDTTGEGR